MVTADELMAVADEFREVRDALDVEVGQRYIAEDFAGGDKLRGFSLNLGLVIAKLLRLADAPPGR